MNKFLRTKEETCSLCAIRNIGKSTQGREMLVLRVRNLISLSTGKVHNSRLTYIDTQ